MTFSTEYLQQSLVIIIKLNIVIIIKKASFISFVLAFVIKLQILNLNMPLLSFIVSFTILKNEGIVKLFYTHFKIPCGERHFNPDSFLLYNMDITRCKRKHWKIILFYILTGLILFWVVLLSRENSEVRYVLLWGSMENNNEDC